MWNKEEKSYIDEICSHIEDEDFFKQRNAKPFTTI